MTRKKAELKDTGERLIVSGNEQTLTYGEHFSRYLSVSTVVKNKKVIDIACGTGYGAQMIATAGASEVYGVDVSKQTIDYAKSKYPHRNLRYLVGDAEKMPLEDNLADIVVSLETIEHLSNPEKFVQEVKRVMKPGGTFIVSTPNDEEFMDGNEFHIHEFQFNELKKLINQHFKYSDFYYQGTYFAATLQTQGSFSTKYSSEKITTSKTFTQNPEKAIYYLAVAGDTSSLPKLEENIVLADRWSTKLSIEGSKETQIRLDTMEDQIEKYKSEIDRLNNVIFGLYNSTSWKITKPIRSLKQPKRRK